MRHKFPSIKHLPWSNQLDDDDFIECLDAFKNQEVIVLEKLDGENFQIYRDAAHARSVDSRDHWTRHWVKGLAGSVQYKIPKGWRVSGENLFAEHSIHYDGLSTFFFVFGVFDDRNVYVAWDEVEKLALELGLRTVPVLYRGTWDEEQIKKCFTGKSFFGDSQQEGYVVRLASSFHYGEFDSYCAKFVRENHVQTPHNWLYTNIKRNELKESLKRHYA